MHVHLHIPQDIYIPLITSESKHIQYAKFEYPKYTLWFKARNWPSLFVVFTVRVHPSCLISQVHSHSTQTLRHGSQTSRKTSSCVRQAPSFAHSFLISTPKMDGRHVCTSLKLQDIVQTPIMQLTCANLMPFVQHLQRINKLPYADALADASPVAILTALLTSLFRIHGARPKQTTLPISSTPLVSIVLSFMKKR